MTDKEYEALRLTFVSLRDSYNKQAYYIERDIYVNNKTVEQVVKANKEAQVLKQVACDINNILYPSDWLNYKQVYKLNFQVVGRGEE